MIGYRFPIDHETNVKWVYRIRTKFYSGEFESVVDWEEPKDPTQLPSSHSTIKIGSVVLR
jgi:hypothetical protein